VSPGDLSYDRYTINGSEEHAARIGPADGPLLLFIPPFFEELNRCRAMLLRTMRVLADRGWTCLLPDLPGTNESLRPLEACSWDDWRAAIRAAAPEAIAGTVAVRGGCLLDGEVDAPCRWRLSPIDGAALLRDLARTGIVTEGADGGYRIATELAALLGRQGVEERPRHRTVRLASDRGQASLKVDFPPPWRRAEPRSAHELADAIACDIDEWMRTCGAS
jgi:pimeloyl-ACP methyl ester carboxylesterase